MKKIAKAKAGTSLGMKSVKAGYDSNPGVTRADIISAGKMNAGKAKNGTKVAAKKTISKAQTGKLLHKVYTEEEADAMPRSKRAWYTGDGGYGSTGTGQHMTVKDAKKRLKMDLKINDLSRKGIDASKFNEKVDKAVKKYNKKVAPKAKKGMAVKKMMVGGKCKMGC
jgi:hypothetical protein